MKLLSWNTARRTRDAARQVDALLARNPDIVALQEVTASTLPILKHGLDAGGIMHIASAVPITRQSNRARATGVLIASRFPMSVVSGGLSLPEWPEKATSAIVHSSLGPVEVNTVHVPPGASHGWKKIEVFRKIFEALAKPTGIHRVLCGDFNAPQAELPTGETICWGKRLGRDGQWRFLRRRKGGSAEEWERAEASVLVGLREFDLHDVFRLLHGFEKPAHSIEMKHGLTITRRRFDHIFASRSLEAISCEYPQEIREQRLSDHTPIEAIFAGTLR